MAVAAATNCLEGIDRATVDGVLFASTSYAYKEKQAASIVAKALDLRRDVVTADFADSLRAGTTALRAALDAVKAGSARNVLVVASDCRAGGAALGARAQHRRRRRRVPHRRHRRRRDVRAASFHRRRDHRRLAHRRRTRTCARGKIASSSSTATRSNTVEAVKGLLQEGRADGEGLCEGGAVRPRRAQPRRRRARLGFDAQDAGAGSALRQARQHRRRVRADAAGRGARREPSPAASCCWPTTATAPRRSPSR